MAEPNAGAGPAPGPPVHPDLADLAFLIGRWQGRGQGHYPTIEDFVYEEQVEFWHSGRPLLGYTQRTRGSDGAPLHSETGYFRAVGEDRIELVVAHSFGLAEIAAGRAAGAVIDTATIATAGTPSVKRIDEVRRRIVLDGDTLVYDLWMDAVGAGLHHHLHGRLTRRAHG